MEKCLVGRVHQHIKVIYHFENILVMLDWFLAMNELVSSDMKITECAMSVFSFSRSHSCVPLIMFCWAQDTTFVVTVCDLLQLRHFTADIFDVNTFLQMCQLSETKLDSW